MTTSLPNRLLKLIIENIGDLSTVGRKEADPRSIIMIYDYKKHGQNLLIFNPAGLLDHDAALMFERVVKNAIKENPFRHILINFKDVSYISSSGMRVLVTIKRIQNENSNEFKIFNVTDFCKKVFCLIHVEELISYYPSEEEAINSFPH